MLSTIEGYLRKHKLRCYILTDMIQRHVTAVSGVNGTRPDSSVYSGVTRDLHVARLAFFSM